MLTALMAVVFAGYGLETVALGPLLEEKGARAFERLFEPAGYRYAQFSSYDRASVRPGEEAWFANADAGKYLRVEGNEHVMMDAAGPGAVLRIWSANPSGTIRFYFDGEETPRIESGFAELFGDTLVPSALGLGYVAARGYNLYLPIPYQKGLKVTLEGPGAGGVYYMVGYRSYPEGTAVESFDPGRAKARLEDWDVPTMAEADYEGAKPVVLTRGYGRMVLSDGPGTVSALKLELGKFSQTWRDVSLQIKVDGETTVDSTVGDFFACPAGAKETVSDAMAVRNVALRGDGEESATFEWFLPMPYGKEIEVTVLGGEIYGTITAVTKPLDEVPAFRFYAQTNYHAGPSRPFRDMTVVDAKGRGRYVGTTLTVENPILAWWGEGDEKVWVDGESFPSIFGTGTEDYFGYAWCDIGVFSRRYHGQPRADGPINFGHISNYRWHTWDDIPFQTSLKFDLEMWHWADTDSRFVTTGYWYGEPGKTTIVRPELPDVRVLEANIKVEGAIEGEDLVIREATGGTTERQGGFVELSGLHQLWWKDPSAGDRLVLEVPVEQAGRYRLVMHLCQAADYGIHRIALNGVTLAETDFYSSSLGWKEHDLGMVDLTAGTAVLTVTCLGQNGLAAPRRMFGLDYIKLVPSADPALHTVVVR